MKQPPTPPEPRKVRGDYKPVPPTPPRVPASNPSIGGEPTKLGFAFWASVIIAAVVGISLIIAILSKCA